MARELKYRKVEGVRTRPVAAAECLIAFSPRSPSFRWLDLNAWLIFELAHGRTREEAEKAYLDIVGARVGHEIARRQLHAGLEALLGSNLIEQEASTVTGETS